MHPRANNFDALRLLGALLVALSHTFVIMRGTEPLGDATQNQTLGGIGLNVFCVISGFLITKSRLSNSPMRFFWARALRIFPALIVAIPLMVLVLGPAFTTLSASEYLTSAATWRFLATTLVFPLNPSLPGVFGGAPLVGQLYSLTAEVGFYIFVGLLAPWKHFRKLVAAMTVAALLFFVHKNYVTLPFSSLVSFAPGGTILFFFPVRLGLTCVYYLLAGSTIALFVRKPERLAPFAPALLVAWIAALCLSSRHQYDLAEMLLFPALVIGFALSSSITVRVPKIMGDISYGIYIYHFFIAEAVLTWTAEGYRTGHAILLATLLSMTVAWLSFRFVEKPALSLKGRVKSGRGQEAAAPMSPAI